MDLLTIALALALLAVLLRGPQTVGEDATAIPADQLPLAQPDPPDEAALAEADRAEA